MPIISGDSLSPVAAELSRRNVKLYHACQLADFTSYLGLGGIPSRNLLSTRSLAYTAFDTDPTDHQNGVWNLVFFNLSDFGRWFAQGRNTVPNPFGPILLCFDPRVICRAVDVSITLRSAGARDFDRRTEGVDADDILRLFIDANSPHVRFAESLREEFGRREAQSPEMSCSFHDEVAPLSCVAYIVVDPYDFPSETLMDMVQRAVGEHDGSWRVFKRSCADGCKTRYATLLKLIVSGIRRADELRPAIPDNSPLSDWRNAVLAKASLSFQFERYARYLSDGTLSYVSSLSRE